jgi:hypothetical protein
MRFEVNINKKYFFAFVLIGLILIGIVGVVAYNSAGVASTFGHSVNEIEWSQVIPGNNITANSFCINTTSGPSCKYDWGGVGTGITTINAGANIIVTTESPGVVRINATGGGGGGGGLLTVDSNHVVTNPDPDANVIASFINTGAQLSSGDKRVFDITQTNSSNVMLRGVGRNIILEGGNVGIGTTDTTTGGGKLTVLGDIVAGDTQANVGDTAVIKVNTASGTPSWIYARQAGTAAFGLGSKANPDTNIYLTNLYDGDNILGQADRSITLTKTGNVGIGTANLNPQFKLNVIGSSGQGGVYGQSTTVDGNLRYGVTGVEAGAGTYGGAGVYGVALASTGYGIGVWGKTNSPTGYAGYFQGKVYTEGNIQSTGSIIASAISTTGSVSATGSISASSISTTGDLAAESNKWGTCRQVRVPGGSGTTIACADGEFLTSVTVSSTGGSWSYGNCCKI